MTDRTQRPLVAAGVLFAVGSTVHIVDHLRRGQGSVTDTLQWAGALALVVQAVVVTLVLTRHRLAPLAAVAAGFPLALGFFTAHWLPEWSALSDPVWEIDRSPGSPTSPPPSRSPAPWPSPSPASPRSEPKAASPRSD